MSSADSSRYRAMITVSAIGATLLQALDPTIANVALPNMQGIFSASYDEITWALTSYITAAAIMTPPVGWLAVRFGRKPLFICCILGFTIASMLCAVTQSLTQIVAFRLLQGMFGAVLMPLSQATLLDIYPPERRGFAMAIWGMRVMVGPITWRGPAGPGGEPASGDHRLCHRLRAADLHGAAGGPAAAGHAETPARPGGEDGAGGVAKVEAPPSRQSGGSWAGRRTARQFVVAG
jgi:hypothetical protein